MGVQGRSFEFQHIAPTLSVILVSFLAIASQTLFRSIEPEPLTTRQAVWFNGLTAGLFLCYYRTCRLDPGRVPKDWMSKAGDSNEGETAPLQQSEAERRRRWCRKCEMPKPPRAHHCKSCGRCIPKMDHHCPWTANCVSHRTMPHFVRFMLYAVSAAGMLQYFLWIRFHLLWQKRHLPSLCCPSQYLGPSISQLVVLLLILLGNSICLFGVGALLLRTLYSIGSNTTTIESWEIDRHATLLRRARYTGGLLDGPDGEQFRIVKQEFPYDIGIYANISQSMGSRNPLVWIWPFAASLPVDSGLAFDENGLEDEGKHWPPPDPDRMYRPHIMPLDSAGAVTMAMDKEAFARRQAADMDRRRPGEDGGFRRRKPFYVRLEERQAQEKEEVYEEVETDGESEGYDERDEKRERVKDDSLGEEAWRNSEGERLADFGVDEDVEFYDEDDLPLAELMRLRKARAGIAT